ncbi:hypothetical protein IWW52_003111 [Coemansia sp. RSA 2704]|nr:hypothetical protein IWW54_003846 [Coemansia sp. RSA 2705]KAJ2317474.1 hypothetical protein IWW52_003111 [Coemansia sp. RSA 2704]
MATLEPEVIDLLSDDSLSDGEPVQRHELSTPIRSHGHRICAAGQLTPGTPELPSPSMLLGPSSNPPSSPTKRPRESGASFAGADTELLSRQAALDLPSSPPLLPDSDDDDCRILDEIINAQQPGPESEPWSDFDDLAAPRVFGSRHQLAMVEFSDAVATEILDSDSSEGGDNELDSDSRIEDLLARASALTKSLRAAQGPSQSPEPARRAASASVEAVSVSTLDTSPLPSELHGRRPPARLAHRERSDPVDGSSSSVHIPWAAEGESDVVACSQAVTQKEKRQREAEARRAEKARARQRREQEKQFARGMSQANKKRVDARELAKDMTVAVDPGVLELLPTPRAAGSGDEGAESTDHGLFARCKESGIGCRVEAGAVPGSVRWEMLVRRRWDARLSLYVPVEPPERARVRRAAMVVLDSARFAELIHAEQLEQKLEIWRASLKAARLFVCVPGLQRLLRAAADKEAREFAQQMRSAMGGGAGRRPRGTAATAQADAAAVEAAVLRMQLTCPWAGWLTQCGDSAAALGQALWQTSVDLALAEHAGDAADSDEPGGAVARDVAAALRVAVVRSGADLADAWARALAQIPRVTLAAAQAVAQEYPTPAALFAAWAQSADGEQLLAGISVASRRLGAVMSARIYRMFNEPDSHRPFAEL